MLGAIQSAPIVDLAIFMALFAWFILGVMQGAIRRLLGILSMLFAFLMSANLRGPVGGYLTSQWHQFPDGYNNLIAFTLLFLVLFVGFSILIQGMYKRMELSAAHPLYDDIAGGLLGLLEGFTLLVIAVIILGSYTMPAAVSGDVSVLRQAQDLLINQSHIAAGLRDHFIPPMLHLLSGLLPGDLVTAFS
jgi:uncharacterized membrane protein required for colicin V production